MSIAVRDAVLTLLFGGDLPEYEGPFMAEWDRAAMIADAIDAAIPIIVGRIQTGFGAQVGDAEARRIGEWVVNGFPWLNGGNESGDDR